METKLNVLDLFSGIGGFSLGLDMLADGVPDRVERVKQCGNAVVPQIPELLGEAILWMDKAHR